MRKTGSKRRSSTSSPNSSESDEWVEKDSKSSAPNQREDWMSMTGMLKTYTKNDIRPKREEKDKKHIDSYNPATCSRELNPYWRNGGTGLPQTSDIYRKSKPFVKPSDTVDYYSKSRKSTNNAMDTQSSRKSKGLVKPSNDDDDDYYVNSRSSSSQPYERHHGRGVHDKYKDERNYNYGSLGTSSWRKHSEKDDKRRDIKTEVQDEYQMTEDKDNKKSEKPVSSLETVRTEVKKESKNNLYLSDEEMNKLAAKIVKAEILGDTKLVEKLKAKLEDAREYRKHNPDAGKEDEDDRVMLISTSRSGNSRPLAFGEKGDSRSKGGKRKAETHVSGERTKYFGNDDKYNLKEMFQQEKYGSNYNDEAELAKIASKHKNPNDDLEDIFMDEIAKNRSAAKDSESEKQRAINQHQKMEKSLDGCEYCVDSKNMLKHLMVSMGNKVYVALPSRRSLVKDQCIITTIQHSTCITSVDEDVWEEILSYRRALTKFYNSQNKDVVFFETATKLHRYPHLVINCVPLPRDVGDMAAIYFKKALLDCEAEWSMNKKVVDLKGKSIRKGVPKGLPYFWIDFGMDPGFAHVIEDQQLFPKTFAEEIICGVLDLDHSLWKNPRKDYGDVQRKKVLDFVKEWKHFDPVTK
ncbi:unnamed protein product [Arctia plantaginis]|uniref:CWF19-like protein 2 n=1 Tax=Arctia plantaginis TaxID=874455 RepID=A0A8S1B2E0_ARCPL|nr:unnamed protein product [Arctia plantaginis]